MAVNAVDNAVDNEGAQLVVGAAIVDARYRRLLLRDRGKALCEVGRQAGAPASVRLTANDRLALGAIPARSLAEFALGVERQRMVLPAVAAQDDTAQLRDLTG